MITTVNVYNKMRLQQNEFFTFIKEKYRFGNGLSSNKNIYLQYSVL